MTIPHVSSCLLSSFHSFRIRALLAVAMRGYAVAAEPTVDVGNRVFRTPEDSAVLSPVLQSSLSFCHC
jgi:hypothetical protein